MRRWCWHDWSPWTDAVPYGWSFIQQMRHCRKCNKTRIRTGT